MEERAIPSMYAGNRSLGGELQAENQVLRNMREDAEKSALRLEAERDRFLKKVS
jgi:hypothetical protein